MTLNLPDTLIHRIQTLAEQRGETPGQLLERLITQDEGEKREPAPRTFAALTKSAIEAIIGADGPPLDTVERSREILRTEFADYLKSRIEYINPNETTE